MNNIKLNLLIFFFFINLLSSNYLVAKPLDNLRTINQTKQQLLLKTVSNQQVKIDFLTDKLFRIWASPNGIFVDEKSKDAKIVIQSLFDSPTLTLTRLQNHYLAKTNNLSLRIYTTPLRFELYKKDNRTLVWKELNPINLNRTSSYQTLSNNASLRFFGGGQQNGAFEFHGKNLQISYSRGWLEGDRPNPAPFYMTNTGYGVLRNTWTNGNYDFRSSTQLKASHKEFRFDAYYFNGDDMKEVLSQYTQLTGRAKLIPRWAFEYGDADCYNDNDNINKPGTVPSGWSDGPTGTTIDVVSSVAKKYRDHDMPGGWILPNDGYGCGYKNLPAVVKSLATYGFKTGLWTENGVDVIAWEVGQAGSRAQKLDVAWTGRGYQFSLDANKAAADGIIKNSSSRPFVWTVRGWAGTQRYAVTWTGDQSGSWDYIRWHIPTLIGSGLSGQVYTTGDVDGIFGGSPETFTRDLQWKALTPVFMGMSGWSRQARKHPWWFNEPYRSINRKYLKLKMRLMPYIYTYARQAETTGAPVVRGLMWDHPNDNHAYDQTYLNQYFLGESLLIAPVYKSQAKSGGWRDNIYLPKGRWIDYWDGRVIDAGSQGKVISDRVTLEKLPMFVKAGAIIPMYRESLYDAQFKKDRLTLDVYPGGNSTFELYEDDGNTRQYLQGKFSLQAFTLVSPKLNAGNIQFSIGRVTGGFTGMFERRNFDLNIHTRAQPQSITLDGSAIRHFLTRREFNRATQGWYFDKQDRYGVVYAKLGKLNVRTQHQVSLAIGAHMNLAKTKSYPSKEESNSQLTESEI